MSSNTIILIIQIILALALILTAYVIYRGVRQSNTNPLEKGVTGFLIGLVTDFGDTLGVGSFATTTALAKSTKFVENDKHLPGFMIVGHTIPTLAEAFLFITAVKVDMTTLITMTIASVLGAYVGAILTRKWDVNLIRRALGTALIIAAIILLIRLIASPGSNNPTDVIGLNGWLLPLGLVVNFILGSLVAVGLGNYAPTLIFFSLVGVNPAVAFPIMMLNTALLLPTLSYKFFRQEDRIQWKGITTLAIGGTVGVVLAFLFVKSLDVTILNYLIVLISIYTAYMLFRDAMKSTKNV